MTGIIARQISLLIIAMSAGIAPASAHHVMGGATPSTFIQGLLSGFGHPVIGLDHLAFLIAVGIVVGVGELNFLMSMIFVGASAVGVALHVYGATLPAAEIMVAGSVLVAGAMLARGMARHAAMWATLFCLAGLFHGYAFGESIVGAERAPLWAYLLGLVAVQTALTVGIALIIRKAGVAVIASAPRVAGAAISAVGFAVLASHMFPSA
jgi:urease accessory protein